MTMRKKGSTPSANISNCSLFMGVKWDKDACESVYMVSKALLNLTELFKNQKVNFNAPMINVGNDGNMETNSEKE